MYIQVYNVLVTPIKQAQAMGYHFESKVIDLTNLELEMGKMMEQGPVLIITFQTQQIMCVKDSKGKVIEGDPVCNQYNDSNLIINYVFYS